MKCDKKIREMAEKKLKTSTTKKGKPKVNVYKTKKKKEDPESALIEKLRSQYQSIDHDSIESFADLPLSPQTLKGLKKCNFLKPTKIQKETIRLSLPGNDILGASQTGSGKTLAFLIPILERLFCERWTNLDGTGALVITPTRELAYQIFENLKKIGEFHDFSAGLIIGGKNLKFERSRMDRINIIIGTPGRLLHHMNENPLFDCVNMKILVLDEADRCLDAGFKHEMNAIIENLPQERQTLLFSATQTESVGDLVRLSLKNPLFVSVDEHSDTTTPEKLKQSYVICQVQDKITILWNFIIKHLKQKIIIFLASQKEVKYVYEIFCKLKPGTALIALYGRLHQDKRMGIYDWFAGSSSAVLFATDVAARGVNFPGVHWVVQADCPEDTDTYIHRVGRTARYHSGGESLLMLLPTEVKMVEDLRKRKIPIDRVEIDLQELFNPVKKMQAILVKDAVLAATAQRAVVAYARSIAIMGKRDVFKLETLDSDAFAYSLGLIKPPRIPFLERRKAAITASKTVVEGNDNPKIQRKGAFHVPDDSDDDDQIKMTNKVTSENFKSIPTVDLMNVTVKNKKKAVTKFAAVKKMLKQKIPLNKKIVFDEEGAAVGGNSKSALAKEYENEDEGGLDIEKAKLVLKEEDKLDKELFRAKVKAKHKEEKRKLKEQKLKENQDELDDFGESESEEEPDLSWLPDPDKIYGKTTESDESGEEKPNKQNRKRKAPPELKKIESEEEKKPRVSRKKAKTAEIPKKSKRNKVKEMSTSLNVNEAEELAMMLLKTKK